MRKINIDHSLLTTYYNYVLTQLIKCCCLFLVVYATGKRHVGETTSSHTSPSVLMHRRRDCRFVAVILTLTEIVAAVDSTDNYK